MTFKMTKRPTRSTMPLPRLYALQRLLSRYAATQLSLGEFYVTARVREIEKWVAEDILIANTKTKTRKPA